ncbi:hypothetical protein ACFLUY_01965 [Chloroflexota bacterium]
MNLKANKIFREENDERCISATEEYGQHTKNHISATISLREASQEMKGGQEDSK